MSTYELKNVNGKRMEKKILKELNSPTFKKMDADILLLRRFVEFCRYNFVTFYRGGSYGIYRYKTI